jgi:hypothetical protein
MKDWLRSEIGSTGLAVCPVQDSSTMRSHWNSLDFMPVVSTLVSFRTIAAQLAIGLR